MLLKLSIFVFCELTVKDVIKNTNTEKKDTLWFITMFNLFIVL